MAQLTTAQAIVVGSVVVGACLGIGVYLGLRGRATATATKEAAPSAPTTDAARTTAATSPAASAATGASPAASGATTTASDASARVRDEAARQIERQRDALVKRCWAPIAAKLPGPPRTTFTVRLVVAPDGKQLTRSMIEPSSGVRRGVAQCVEMTLGPLDVTAPGAPMTVTFPVTMP